LCEQLLREWARRKCDVTKAFIRLMFGALSFRAQLFGDVLTSILYRFDRELKSQWGIDLALLGNVLYVQNRRKLQKRDRL
jgi:hypothetical protein